MCGLVGMVGTLDYRHKKVMKELLFLDTLRGRDSTGLTSVKRNRDLVTRKFAVPGYEFIEMQSVDKALENNDQLWMGHNRFKTVGDVSRANAHPFEVCAADGSILMVGAHNGTLENKYEIERAVEDKFDTDSEALMHLLYKEDTYKEAIAKLKGAWALTWWDPFEDELHFCRNDQRSLYYAYTEDKKALVWASEAWMLINACLRNDVKLLKNDRGMSTYLTLSDHLYTLKIPQQKDEVLPDLQREGGHAGKAKFFQGHSQCGFQRWWSSAFENQDDDDDIRYLPKRPADDKEKSKEGEEGKKETTTFGTPSKVDIELVVERPGPDEIRGYQGKIIPRSELEELKKAGCQWNGCSIGKVWGFLDEGALVCGDCLRDTHPKDFAVDLAAAEKEDYDKLIGAASSKAAEASVG